MNLRGNIASSFLQLLIDWLTQEGEPPERWIPQRDVPAGELSRIDINTWKALLENVSADLQRPELGLLIGQRLGLGEAGLLGYIASCCANMAEACLRLAQFEHLVYNVNPLEVRTNSTHITLCWGIENGRPGVLVDDCAIAGLVGFCRSLGGQAVTPDLVAFVNPPPSDPAPYEAFFRCELRFDQSATVVRYPLAAMAAPIASANPTLQAALDHKARSLLVRLPTSGEPLPGLYRAIQDAVSAGSPTVQHVAQRLLMSSRSLQRTLREAETTFQAELDRIRLAMAQQHLKEGSASIQEIAWMLAYNDHSAFVHAFRRLTGETPTAFRRQQ